MFFGGKQKILESLIDRYLTRVQDCLDRLEACLEASLAGEPFELIAEKARATHQAESQADDTRREICILLYGKALFPESRGDILAVIESTDKLANAAESVARQILHERLQIPAELGEDFRELLRRTRACAGELLRGVRMLFEDYHSAVHLADRVDGLESRADEMEFSLIERVFRSGLGTGEKILLRDLIRRIGDIADRAEDTGDRVRIAAIKRRV